MPTRFLLASACHGTSSATSRDVNEREAERKWGTTITSELVPFHDSIANSNRSMAAVEHGRTPTVDSHSRALGTSPLVEKVRHNLSSTNFRCVHERR